MTVKDIQLDTPRLVLRPPQRSDLDSWADFMTDSNAVRFIGGPTPRAVTWRSIMTMIGAWHEEGFAMFSVIEKATGRWIGRLGPWCPEGWPGTEVGWAIVREKWGQGLATEGAIAATNWAFDHLGWTEVIHTIAPDNIASQLVAQRLGSYNRGPGRLPPPFQESVVEVWGQTRDEWLARWSQATKTTKG